MARLGESCKAFAWRLTLLPCMVTNIEMFFLLYENSHLPAAAYKTQLARAKYEQGLPLSNHPLANTNKAGIQSRPPACLLGLVLAGARLRSYFESFSLVILIHVFLIVQLIMLFGPTCGTVFCTLVSAL